jgi:cytochrome c-type biogenesis protein CcmH/NrfF
MSSSDLKESIDWANRSSSEPPSNWMSWLPIIFIGVLLVIAGWWWWMNYGRRNTDVTTSSTTFNDLKAGAQSDNPLFVKPNGKVVS